MTGVCINPSDNTIPFDLDIRAGTYLCALITSNPLTCQIVKKSALGIVNVLVNTKTTRILWNGVLINIPVQIA